MPGSGPPAGRRGRGRAAAGSSARSGWSRRRRRRTWRQWPRVTGSPQTTSGTSRSCGSSPPCSAILPCRRCRRRRAGRCRRRRGRAGRSTGTPKKAAASARRRRFASPSASTPCGLPLMSLPAPGWLEQEVSWRTKWPRRERSSATSASRRRRCANDDQVARAGVRRRPGRVERVDDRAVRDRGSASVGSCGDWPCLAERMIAVVLRRPRALELRDHRADLRVDVVERAREQRAGRHAVGEVAAGQAVARSGSFSAVETVWKFIPKIAGRADLGSCRCGRSRRSR